MKSQMENAREDWTGRGGGTVDRGLKSQIKKVSEGGSGGEEWRMDEGLKSQIENVRSHIENAEGEGMWRAGWRKTVD